MRKYTALFLALCMCLFALCIASCKKNEDSADTGTETTTTVTEEEWNAMFQLTNVTVVGTYTERDLPETVTVKIVDKKCVSEVLEGNGEIYRAFTFFESGKWYYGEESDGKYVCDEASWINGESLNIAFVLGSFTFQSLYTSFVYDEESKAYVYTTAEQTDESEIQVGSVIVQSYYTSFPDTYTVTVENGSLKSVEIIDGGYESKLVYPNGDETVSSDEGTTFSFTFSDYDTTVIDGFPSFCTSHTAVDAWSTDENLHWHACQTQNCGQKIDKGWHDVEDGVCTVCGYEK